MWKKKNNTDYEKKFKDNFGSFYIYCFILAIVFGAVSIVPIIKNIIAGEHLSEIATYTFIAFIAFLGSIFVLFGLNWAYKAIEKLRGELEFFRTVLSASFDGINSQGIKYDWIDYVIRCPDKEAIQFEGTIWRRARIEEANGMYLRVVQNKYGTTAHWFFSSPDLSEYFSELE